VKKRFVPILAALAIGLAVPALAQEQNTVDPEIRHQIEAALLKYHEAYNKSDAAATAAQFTEDAVEIWQGVAEGGLASGQQAIKKRYEAELAASPHITGKLVQVYTIGNDICAITELKLGSGAARRSDLYSLRAMTGRSAWPIPIDRLD
jgi:hypothetical protein